MYMLKACMCIYANTYLTGVGSLIHTWWRHMPTTSFYPWLSLLDDLQYWCLSSLQHITLSLVEFQHSGMMTFLYLNIYAWSPLHHTTLSLIQFLQHSSMVTFLHWNIYVWVPSSTPFYPWFNFNIQVWWSFCTWIFTHPLHHTQRVQKKNLSK